MKSGGARPTLWLGLAVMAGLGGTLAVCARDTDPTLVIAVDPQGATRSGGMTLGRALDRAAALRRRDPDAAVTIQLPPGLTRMDGAARIGLEDSGTARHPLVIRGAPDGTTVLSGSVALDLAALPLPPDLAARLPPAARPHVRVYRLPAAALARPRIQESRALNAPSAPVALEVFDRSGALVPARWPDQGWARTATGSAAAEPSFTVDPARAARWLGEPDLWAEGFWRWDSIFEGLPVLRVDHAAGRITLSGMPEGGIGTNARVRVSHALAELDRPGEWWRDEARGLLLAWPRDLSGRIEVSVADTLLDVAGASHVRIEHLGLEHGRGDLVSVRGGSDVVVRNAVLRWAGARAAAFTDAAASGLEDCDVSDTGDAGVLLRGGDRRTLAPGGLFVRGSRFTRYARLSLTQQPGVEVEGVGAAVEGNLFHDATGAAVMLHGNDHRVAGNEITRLLGGLSDSGAIYAGRDWTARGTVIVGNYLHDLRADPGLEIKGVYLDDFASGFAVLDNLFVRVDKPVFLGGGRDNAVTGNLFVASSPAIHVDSRGRTWASASITDPGSELRGRYGEVPVWSATWRRRYPDLSGILDDEPAAAKRNRLAGNAFVLSTPFDFSDGGRQGEQVIEANRGPDGIGPLPAPDLAALAASGQSPGDFADLVDSKGTRLLPPLPGLPR